MPLNEITRRNILKAIEECDRMGREAFLAAYGFKPSVSYFLSHDGSTYDSKAIVGVAHGYARPDLGPLTFKQFTGGETIVAPLLRRLGFEVTVARTRNSTWTRDEL